MPPALHHEFAIRAADAGKHIIMEKPLEACRVEMLSDVIKRVRDIDCQKISNKTRSGECNFKTR